MLQNSNVHQSCFCYKAGSDSVLLLREFPSAQAGMLELFAQEILFVTTGSVSIAIEGKNATRELSAGDFVFLPAGLRLSYRACGGSGMLSMRLIRKVPECHVFGIERLARHMEGEYEELYAFSANDRIRAFVAEVIVTLRDGLRCNIYMQLEVGRMLFMLHAYYPTQERVRFFSGILSPDMKFSTFVRENFMNSRSVEELAAAMCMTPQQFRNRFRRVFGTSPLKWIQQEKAQMIYQDICRTDMPIKEISEKYDFPVLSNFFRFCRRHYGESPGSIRRNMKNILPEHC